LKDVQLVVVNYKTYPLLQQFIDSYLDYRPSCSSDLLIVDVESTDEIEGIRTYGYDVIREPNNIGYARACNLASSLTYPRSRNIAFFNADTRFVNNTCVDTCVEFLDNNDEVGVVGPLQFSSFGRVTHAGIFGTRTKPEHRAWRHPLTDSLKMNEKAISVSGSAYFTKSRVWKEMMNCPIFIEQFPTVLGAFPDFDHFYEETLYSYHMYAHGYECWYVGEAEMIHEWHQSSPVGSQSEKMRVSQVGFRQFCDSHEIDHD